jgi:dipeptide/tripeptide permease
VVTIFYCAIGVGTFLAAFVVGPLSQFVSFTAALALAASVALAALITFRMGVAPTGTSEDRRPGRPLGLAVALVIATVMFPMHGLIESAGLLQLQLGETTRLGNWFQSLNPIASGVAGILTAGGLIALGLTGSKLRTTAVFGAGTLLLAIAALTTLLSARADDILLGKLIAAAAFGGVGERLLNSAAIALIITAASPRWVPLALAAFYLGSFGAGTLVDFAEGHQITTPLAWGAFGAALVVGVVVLTFAGVLQRRFFDHGLRSPDAAPDLSQLPMG